ncbi:MAG: DoxX family protein [Chloroflexi bacterium]|nr:DoxX family protein [Chloroflexota bacterium]
MTNSDLRHWLDGLDYRIVRWLARHSLAFLRIGLGIIFVWFGGLKFFPNLSPATDLAVRTIHTLTFGFIPDRVSLILLATLETAIGLGFLTGKSMRLTLALLAFQMAGTLTPLALFPEETFLRFPFAPTLEGQYILKNLVLIGAGLVIGATVRGGRLVADPEEVPRPKSSVSTRPVRVDQS